MPEEKENPFELPKKDAMVMHQRCGKCGSENWTFGFQGEEVFLFCAECDHGLKITVEEGTGKLILWVIKSTGITHFPTN